MNKRLISETCGDLMTKKEFIECVRCGGFIDYDGYGKYSDGVYVYDDVTVKPSNVLNGVWDGKYKYVVWYNK